LIYIFGQRYLAEDQLTRDTEARATPQPLTEKEWRGIWGLGALCALNIVFWGVYEQQGNTIQIFADKNTNWHVLGWEMPSTWFQSMNPAFIFLLAPLLNVFWAWQSRRSKEPGSVTKMTLGCVFLGASFLVLIYAVNGMQETTKISFLWLVACTFVYTLGELYLSPIGLSLVTKVAPKRLVGMLMGMWFLSSFFGNYLAGYIGMYYERMPKDAFFLILAALGGAAGISIFAVRKPLKNAIGHSI